MPYFKDIRDACLVAYSANWINMDEYLVLNDIYKSKNPDLSHSTFSIFDLDLYNDDQSKVTFRFLKNHIYDLKDALRIPEEISCYNNVTVDGIEALSIFLKRFAYPCRYADMVPLFGRPVPQLSIISNHIMNLIFDNWGHLLNEFNQNWLSPENLKLYSNAIHQKGGALDNCWGFIDGTVRPICRPGEFQRIMYNGHKRVHALKFQSVVAPNGFIANLYGPVEGKRHDSGMLRMSQLLDKLETYSYDQNRHILCLYGDPAYPLRPHLQAPFRGANLTAEQQAWNKSMSEVRVSVEWIFGDVANYFKFLDFKKDLKIGLSAVGKMYLVCALLHNARVSLYGSTTSLYFDVAPPTLQDYFR